MKNDGLKQCCCNRNDYTEIYLHEIQTGVKVLKLEYPTIVEKKCEE
jgi:hypothetical protein